MRDFSCFGDGSVSLAAAAAGAGAALDRSLQAATASVYKAAISSRKELLVKVTWTRNFAGAAGAAAAVLATGLAVAIDKGPAKFPSAAAVAATPRMSIAALMPVSSQQFLHDKRGNQSFVTKAGTVVAIYWDTADAKYPTGPSPEPSRDYCLAIVADAELALLLGGGESSPAVSPPPRIGPS